MQVSSDSRSGWPSAPALTVALAAGTGNLPDSHSPAVAVLLAATQRPYAAGALAVAAAVRDRDAVAAGVDRFGIRRSAAEAVAGTAVDFEHIARTRPGVDQPPRSRRAAGAAAGVAWRQWLFEQPQFPSNRHLRQARARAGTGLAEADAAPALPSTTAARRRAVVAGGDDPRRRGSRNRRCSPTRSGAGVARGTTVRVSKPLQHARWPGSPHGTPRPTATNPIDTRSRSAIVASTRALSPVRLPYFGTDVHLSPFLAAVSGCRRSSQAFKNEDRKL